MTQQATSQPVLLPIDRDEEHLVRRCPSYTELPEDERQLVRAYLRLARRGGRLRQRDWAAECGLSPAGHRTIRKRSGLRLWRAIREAQSPAWRTGTRA